MVVGILAAAICGRLGMWQLDRLEQRRARNALIESGLALPPVDLEFTGLQDSLQFRRSTATGVFDFARQVVVVGRSYQGVPGVHVVTPLQLSDGSAVLVERGWAPSPDGRTVDLGRFAEPDSVDLEGVLHQAEAENRLVPAESWPIYVTAVNPAQLVDRFSYPLRPAVLRRTSEARSPQLRSVQLPELTNGPHLSYAVQWFTFATIALVGGGILAFKGVGSSTLFDLSHPDQ